MEFSLLSSQRQLQLCPQGQNHSLSSNSRLIFSSVFSLLLIQAPGGKEIWSVLFTGITSVPGWVLRYLLVECVWYVSVVACCVCLCDYAWK